MPQIVESQLGLPLCVETRSIGGLGETSLCEVAVVDGGALASPEYVVLLSSETALERGATMITE